MTFSVKQLKMASRIKPNIITDTSGTRILKSKNLHHNALRNDLQLK